VCSGVLIAKSVVVSAKHCRSEGSPTLVYLKGDDYTKAPNTRNELIKVKKSVVHPGADLSILLLDKPSTVTPRRIARESDFDGSPPTDGTIVGFGSILLDGTPGNTRKRVASGLPIEVDFDEPEFFGGHRGRNSDTCKGDSGGPLYVRINTGEDAVLGITLHGIQPNGHCGKGGFYLRLEPFLDWINAEAGTHL
jgi:hypothetical protein